MRAQLAGYDSLSQHGRVLRLTVGRRQRVHHRHRRLQPQLARRLYLRYKHHTALILSFGYDWRLVCGHIIEQARLGPGTKSRENEAFVHGYIPSAGDS